MAKNVFTVILLLGLSASIATIVLTQPSKLPKNLVRATASPRFWPMAFINAFIPNGELYVGKLDLHTELMNPEGGGGPGFWGDKPVSFGVKRAGHNFYYPLLPRFSTDGICYFAELWEKGKSEHESATVSWWKLGKDNKTPELVSDWSELPQANYVMPDRKRILCLEPLDEEAQSCLSVPYALLHHGDSQHLPVGKNLYLFNPRTGGKEAIGEENDEPVIAPTLAPLPKDEISPPGWFYFIFSKKFYKVKADGRVVKEAKTLSHEIFDNDFMIDRDVTKIYYLGHRAEKRVEMIAESLITGSYRYIDWNCNLSDPIFSPDGSHVYLESFFDPPALAQVELAAEQLVQLPIGIKFSSQYHVSVRPLSWRLDGSLELLLDIYHRPSNTKQFRYYRYSPATMQFSLEHSGAHRAVDVAVVDERLTKRAVLGSTRFPRSPRRLVVERKDGSQSYLAHVDPVAFSPDGQWLAFRLWNSNALFVEHSDKSGHLHQVWEGMVPDRAKGQVIFDQAVGRFGRDSREKFAWRLK